jgi:hypothetical protein
MRTLRSLAVIVLAAVLGAAAVQELVVRGIRGGEGQPLVVGVAGVAVCALAVAAALALWRRSRAAPRLATVGGVLAIAFHLFAALPPERNVGALAMALGVLMGVLLLSGSRAALRQGAAASGSVAAA